MSSEELLLVEAEDQGENDRNLGWWRSVLDMEEAKRQIILAFPLILMNLGYSLITLVSVMFAGHQGDLQLAGATLANSWAYVSGFSVMVGLSGSLETLCGQDFGAKHYRMLGLHLQASCIITIFFCFIISIMWFYTDTILVLFQQDAQISRTAALYMKFLIPGVFAYGLLQNMLRFLQTQSVVKLLIAVSISIFGLHVIICYLLVYSASLGFVGAPLATSISLWISVIFLVLYIIYSDHFKETWLGLKLESLSYVNPNLKIALPSAGMICLEYWAFEILVLLAGLMPNSDVTTSLIAICVNTETIVYMISYGFSAATSTRVSNELGGNNPDSAKKGTSVSVILSISCVLVIDLMLGVGNRIWSSLFTSSSTMKVEFASMIPLLLMTLTVDSFQGILSGAFRGCGWQMYALFSNFITFYLIGLPVACVLAFSFKLYTKGLWIGLFCGLSSQACTLLLVMIFMKWKKRAP